MKKLSLIAVLILTTSAATAQDELIAPTLTKGDLISYLEANYAVSNSLSYSAARDAMFEEIDGKSGVIRCVYTGYSIEFTDRQDAQDGNNEGSDFNTEHIWPQSFFDSSSPMRSDIHHLYPTRQDVNGARSNFKFDEISDAQTNSWWSGNSNQSSIPTDNIDEYSELRSNTSFEPREDHKGNVARAVFYFWTIYQNDNNITSDGTDNEAFFEEMKDVLLMWHDADPVDSTETSRSEEIAVFQGNRNPFVHDTTLVRRAYFDGIAIPNEFENAIPKQVELYPNYPNPFNPGTVISYSLNQPEYVSLKVFDLTGREIAILEENNKSEGRHSVQFDATGLASGVYIYQLKVGAQTISNKMLLVK